jgi:hypothetical protein
MDETTTTLERHGTLEKALRLNLARSIYGTFAEIGAGQEVADWFFRAGGASGTVAKTMSAYDMTFSDEIYGKTRRYVSRERLMSMLDHEYAILLERLAKQRAEETTFFTLANTVRAKGYSDNGQECHGWLGLRFQMAPDSPPSDIVLHVRLLDDTNREQAEAMGILGVNLLFAAFYQRQSLPTFIAALMDGLNRWRVEIDLLDFDGPAFERPEFEDRICALQLVQSGLTDAALFTRNGEICMAADYLYKRPVFVKRGSFDPITLLNLDMMEKGRAAFVADFGEAATGHVEVTEISMHNLLSASGEVTHADFLARADVLQSLGHDVLISKYPEFHRLSGYLARYTKMPIGIVLGLPLFEELFREKWYEDLAGGVLEGFGRLFRHQVRLYVYPSGNAACGGTRALGDANVDDLQKPLLEYLVRGDCVRPISGVDPKMLCMTSGEVRQMVRDGDMRWKGYVPKVVIENGRWG